jgi:antitoxin MazE
MGPRYSDIIDTWRAGKMRAIVKKWGNSASVRIPAAVMRAAHMELNEAVDVREESGRIVIEPVRLKEYNLDELLKQITRKNLHEEVDFGGPVGNEAW